jgi:parallel beta-helix repeat protein
MNMRRLLISLLSLAALAVPTSSWEASTSGNLAITVTAGQAITGVSLSNSTFAGGAASGTIVGAISVTMSPSSPVFSGSLSLSGANASQFQISGGNLTTNGVVAAGTYQVNIVATETGVTGSPLARAETITGTDPPPTGAESPGPSQALFNSPYYSCVRNFYVATNGSDSNTGTSPSTPWRTIAHADTSSRTGGDCINVASGSYSAFNGNISHGGTTASSTGYVTYRCTAPGFTTGNPTGGCVIADGGKSVCTGSGVGCGTAYPSYLIFDGFSFINTAQNQFASAFTCSNGDVGPVSPGCHHWVMINNVISGYGQGGIQMNNSEYEFTLHNLFYNNAANSGCDAGAQGSGVSYGSPLPVSGYSQTSDDIGPSPKLGIYGSVSPNPIHEYVEWNVTYNNHMSGCGTGNSTDGNGIIMDTFDSGSTGVNYSHYTLIAFNIVYNNGGQGIKLQNSSNVIVANNDCFHNTLDTANNGTGRGCIHAVRDGDNYTPGNDVLLNNLSYDFIGGGVLSSNSPFNVGGYSGETSFDAVYNGGTSCGLAIGGVTECGGHNIDYLNGYSGMPGGEVPVYNANPDWSCTGNKCMTNPLWVDVGSSSVGTMTAPPAGTNFALQSTSPAIGYGQTRPYLPAQAVDAGACYHTLTSCP